MLLQNAITQATTEIDVSALPGGLYFLQLQATLPGSRQGEQQRWVKKFVKE